MVSRTDDEELAVIKDWWQQNGKPLLIGVVLALVAVFGWQGWQKYQADQAHGASLVYQQLLEAALDPSGKPDAGKVAELANTLKNDYAGTHYAQYGSLFVAKVAVEAGKLADAASELQSIVDKPADGSLAELARQRLARVLAAQDKAEEALKLLDAKVAPAFTATREELKGDLLVQLGRADEAHAAYEKAKAALSEEAAVGGLQMKLDDLAKGDA
ncbi:tetratricopeptide repeat protein [Pseudomonas sp. TMP25]|uniref:tetratricopeptide repeat protein n=1 Tax=Pseudomonas sp. TMP25 TaxID=3136561 RepID=UPI0031016AFD